MRELTESHREAQERFLAALDIGGRLKGRPRRASVRERGAGSYPTSESCCAGWMAGFEGERISTPLAVK